MAQNKDVETVRDSEVAAVQPRPADLFKAYLIQRAEQPLEGMDASDIEADQLARILAAETEDDIWNADLSGTIAARDLVGSEVEIQGMNIFLSNNPDYETFLGVFATFPCAAIAVPEEVSKKTNLSPGSEFIMSTGASGIIAKVRAFEAREMIPVKALITGVTTGRGNQVLKLSKPAARAVRGSTD